MVITAMTLKNIIFWDVTRGKFYQTTRRQIQDSFTRSSSFSQNPSTIPSSEPDELIPQTHNIFCNCFSFLWDVTPYTWWTGVNIWEESCV